LAVFQRFDSFARPVSRRRRNDQEGDKWHLRGATCEEKLNKHLEWASGRIVELREKAALASHLLRCANEEEQMRKDSPGINSGRKRERGDLF